MNAKLYSLVALLSFASVQPTVAVRCTEKQKGYVRQISDYLHRTKVKNILRNGAIATGLIGLNFYLLKLYSRGVDRMTSPYLYPSSFTDDAKQYLVTDVPAICVPSLLATLALLLAKGENSIVRSFVGIDDSKPYSDTDVMTYEEEVIIL